jgi:hypothetical protein
MILKKWHLKQDKKNKENLIHIQITNKNWIFNSNQKKIPMINLIHHKDKHNHFQWNHLPKYFLHHLHNNNQRMLLQTLQISANLPLLLWMIMYLEILDFNSTNQNLNNKHNLHQNNQNQILLVNFNNQFSKHNSNRDNHNNNNNNNNNNSNLLSPLNQNQFLNLTY